jgi:hypothetical protein
MRYGGWSGVLFGRNETDMTKPVRAKFPTSGGFSEGEVTEYDKNDVIAESEKSLKQGANPVQIGQDVAKANEYLGFAKEGCGFLVAHAPEEDRTKQAIAIAHPFGLKFAEKYNRLTLEELA